MNFTRQFVALTMAALRADGKMDSVELDAIKELSVGLELDPNEVNSDILAETNTPSEMDAVIGGIESERDRSFILEACIQVVLADNILAAKEVKLLLDICRKLHLPEEQMVMNLAMVCQNNRGIHIYGSESDFDEDEWVEED